MSDFSKDYQKIIDFLGFGIDAFQYIIEKSIHAFFDTFKKEV